MIEYIEAALAAMAVSGLIVWFISVLEEDDKE